jgi:threonine/homoserine/homoserine lactone efflux protein
VTGAQELAAWAGVTDLRLLAAAVFAVNLAPGVDVLLTVTRTLQSGARAGMAAALGIGAGCCVHAVGAAFGLAALLAVSATAFAALKWLGAVYLLWLAIGLLRQAFARSPARLAPDAQRADGPRRVWADFRQGLLTNLLNPKVAIFFVAFLPQFVAPSAASQTAALLFLGAWFVLQSLLFLALLVALSHSLRRVKWPDGLRRVVQASAAALFAALAARLAVSRLPVA